jgi:hypothetical protein
LFFDRQATDQYRFRHWSIRCAPILAGLSPIPPGAAVSADVGFILIAISAERVVIKIRLSEAKLAFPRNEDQPCPEEWIL